MDINKLFRLAQEANKRSSSDVINELHNQQSFRRFRLDINMVNDERLNG